MDFKSLVISSTTRMIELASLSLFIELFPFDAGIEAGFNLIGEPNDLALKQALLSLGRFHLEPMRTLDGCAFQLSEAFPILVRLPEFFNRLHTR